MDHVDQASAQIHGLGSGQSGARACVSHRCCRESQSPAQSPATRPEYLTSPRHLPRAGCGRRPASAPAPRAAADRGCPRDHSDQHRAPTVPAQPAARVERVPQPVADEVERQHAQRHRRGREEHQVRRLEQVRARIVQHRPPGGRRRLHAQPQEAQRGLRQYRRSPCPRQPAPAAAAQCWAGCGASSGAGRSRPDRAACTNSRSFTLITCARTSRA
jgi:hypothetical protein